jgi:hypothetical protein
MYLTETGYDGVGIKRLEILSKFTEIWSIDQNIIKTYGGVDV